MNLRAKLRVLAVGLAALLPVFAVPSAVAGSVTIALTASDRAVTYGDAVTISGTVDGDDACAVGRPVQLQWRAADSSGYATVGEGETSTAGAFSFERSQAHTGRYRVVLPVDGACTQTTSDELSVRVRAFVDASVVSGSNEAGSCVDVAVLVSPTKPGQTVELQQRRGGSWTVVETVTLNGDGAGRSSPCLGWDDVGVVRYRVRWPAQDPLNETGTSPVLAFEVVQATWMRDIADAIGNRAVSVSVAEDGDFLYRQADQVERTPASNEKLLLSMAAFDAFGADATIATRAAARSFDGGVVSGDLWILGRGDPTVGRSDLGGLADRLVEAGLERVRGRVMGSTTYFRRDWDAPGWNSVARDYVNRPTALTFEGNHDATPELEAARILAKQLEERGVRLGGRPGWAAAPSDLDVLAAVESPPMRVILAKVLRPSWNFGAEVVGKALGASVRGAPGTIAKGAAAIEAWVDARGVDFELFDNSGLSYANRVTAAGIVELLGEAEDEAWGSALRRALPTGGQGTLEHRLHHVRFRAKTGTLTDVSALSGYVFAERRGEWVEFSILCQGMSKSVASDIEDEIVRILADYAN